MKKQPLKEMLKAIGGGHLLNEARKYKLGDMWRKDFDYEGMLEMGAKAQYPKMSGEKLEKLASSFEDVNYHTVAKPLWDALKNLEADQYDDKLAKNLLKKFNKMCKDELKGKGR